MADDLLTLKSKLELDIKESERKIERFQKKLQEAMKSGTLGDIDRIDRALDAENAKLDSLKKKWDDVNKKIKESGDATKKSSDELTAMDKVAGGLAKTMAGVFSLRMAKQFVSQIMSVRGSFQQLEIAFETMLGSKERADKMMKDAVALAAKTPFDLQGVAAGAKSLLAFGMNADDVIGTLRRLGDVSAGLSLPLGRLTTIYGQTMVKGKLVTRDLIRYQQAGVPILEELSKVLGKTTTQVREMVTAGKVGFETVQKVFENMTNEGGRFANLMEKQSASITGRISNIQDSIDVMFNEIGQKTEGPINKALELTGKLVENYEKVGKAIGLVVLAYGLERAATMAYIALKNSETVSTSAAAAAKLKDAVASGNAAAAQTALNKALLSNPYVLVGAALAGLTAGIILYANHLSAAGKAEKELSTATAKVEAEAAKELATLTRLRTQMESVEKDSEAYKKTKQELISQFGKYNSNLETEITNIDKQAEAYDNLKKSIMEAARVRVYETFVSTQTSKISEELTDLLPRLKERIDKHLKPDEAGSLYGKILEYIYGDTDELKLTTPGEQMVFASDIFQQIFGRSTRQWVEDAREDFKAMQTLNEDAKKMFGVTDDMLKTKNKPEPTTPNGDTPTDKQLQREYNARKRNAEQMKKLSRETAQAEIKAEQDRINLTHDANVKRRLQNELDFKKEMQQIREQREDKLKELQDIELSKWQEENPEGKEFQFKPKTTELPKEIAEMYDQMEEMALDKWVNANNDAYKEMVKDFGEAKAQMLLIENEYADRIAEAEENAAKAAEGTPDRGYYTTLAAGLRKRMQLEIAKMNNEDVSQYGNTAQKKDALSALWKAQIDAAPAAIKTGMQEAFDKALSELDLEEFKNSINWTAVFGNLSEQGSKTIAENMGKVQQYLDSNRSNLGVNEIRDLEEALASMSAELANRNPFAAMALSLKDVDDAKQEAEAALAEYRAAIAAQRAEEEKYQARKTELDAQYNSGVITQTEYLDGLKLAASGLTDTQNAVTASTDRLYRAENKATTGTAKFIAGLSSARAQVRGVGDGFRSLVGVLDDDLADALGNAMDLFSDLGDIAMEIAEQFAEQGAGLVEGMEDVAEGTADAVEDTAEATSAAMKAAEASSVVLLAVQAVLKVLTAVFSIIKANRDAEHDAATAAREYALALEQLNDAARLENLQNAFGTDSLGQFRANLEQVADAMQKINDLRSGRASAWADAGPFGAGLADNFIADMRSGWQKFWNSGQENIITKSISDFFDEAGNLKGKELAKWFDEYQEYLDDGTKDLIDSMLTEYDRFKEASEGMADYLSNLFGDVAANVADSMVESFIETGDALTNLTDLASEFGRKMAKSAVTGMLMRDVFNAKSQKMIQDMLSAGNVAGAVDYYNQLIEKANEQAPAITEFLRSLNLDIDPDSRTGEQKGIAQASQDSVDELNGRATVIQSHTYSINETVRAIREQNTMLFATTSSILSEVRGIHSDTQRMNDTLDDIANRNRRIDGNVEWIINKGIRLS